MTVSDAYRTRIRTRLAVTLKDVADRATAARIAEEHAERHRSLLRHADALGITAEPDIKPGFWITRYGASISGRGRGKVNLTSTTSCTCSDFGIYHRCPCQAVVIETLKAESIIALHYGHDEAA